MSKTVPFIDLNTQNKALWPEILAAITDVCEHGQFILGPAVARFEDEFAAYCGTRHCIGVNNGTSALHMVLVASDIGPGDEIITTPHSWISTSWAINYVGATPVFVDIDPDTYNLDAEQVEAAITPATKAILPVHLYGQLADRRSLSSIAEKHGLLLIEDSAQAHGAKLDGRRAGSIGDFGCFSFYPAKNLGCFGEGGAITTDSTEKMERLRALRDHAQNGRHNHLEIGFNTRMEGIQGAVLSVKLKKLDEWIAARQSRAQRYLELLEGIDGIVAPKEAVPGSHVWHLFVVQVCKGSREALMAHLANQNIGATIHYPTPIPNQPAFSYLGHRPGDFPVAEKVMGSCLSLPMYPEMPMEYVDLVVNAVKDWSSQ